MPIRIPKNQIVFNYTSGGEYLLLNTQKEYQGHYYGINNKFFAGKEFNTNAPEIVKLTSNKVIPVNQPPSVGIYSKLSGITQNNPSIESLPVGGDVPEADFSSLIFYCKKINDNQIKQISKDTYLTLKKNPIYQTSFIGNFQGKDQSLEDANTEIPGLKDWYLSDQLSFLSLPKENISTNIKLTQQLFSNNPLSSPPPPTGSVTDTPKPQDIVPVGPIYIVK